MYIGVAVKSRGAPLTPAGADRPEPLPYDLPTTIDQDLV
jgi:hypothetical protein